MAKCPNPECGAEVEDGVKFCMECGTKIPQPSDAGSGMAVGGAPLMGDKNVIAGDVNNSVSMSNSNNTTNNTVNNTTNNTTNNVSNTTHNVSNVTNNSTTNNTYIRQEIKEETELDKEAKRVQIEKLRLEKEAKEKQAEIEKEAMRVQLEQLRLEKEAKEKEFARRHALEEAALEAEKTRKAAEIEKERIKLKAIQDEANKSPYSKSTFRKLGLWGGFLGIHYAYVRRWPMFGATLALVALMVIFGKHDAPEGTVDVDAAKVEVAGPANADAKKESEKPDVLTMIIGLPLMVLWFGGAFFVTTDAQGRKLV